MRAPGEVAVGLDPLLDASETPRVGLEPIPFVEQPIAGARQLGRGALERLDQRGELGRPLDVRGEVADRATDQVERRVFALDETVVGPLEGLLDLVEMREEVALALELVELALDRRQRAEGLGQ